MTKKYDCKIPARSLTPGSDETDAAVKAASDKRRAARKKKNIRIERDRIVDRDEENRQRQRKAVKPQETGYVSECRILNHASRWNWARRMGSWCFSWMLPSGEKAFPDVWIRRVELPEALVRDKVATRCTAFFKGKGENTMYMIFPPLQHLKKTSIQHVERYKHAWAHKYAFHAELDMTPEPQEILFESGVNPARKSQVYRLVELMGRDELLGDDELIPIYRMEPVME